MAKHPNPLEKEFLIRQFKSNRRIRLSDFCTANHVSDAAFRKWLQQYNEGGIEGLARADMEIREVLPEGIDRTEEVYKREILKLISHTPSEGVGISGISHTPSILLWKEWKSSVASICSVGPFFVCHPLLLLRKESAFPAFPILLRKEWKSSVASICSVEPFFLCNPRLLLRKESVFPAFSILLRKEWNSRVASVCSVEPFFLCHPRLLLRKEWTKWGYVGRCSTISEGVERKRYTFA